MPRVRIFDTTLRDGEQSVSVGLKPRDKVEIAAKLGALGVDAIEAGFPITSPGEATAVKEIAAMGLQSEVYALARTSKAEIDLVAQCGVSSVHVFISTSDIHLHHKLGISKGQALEMAGEAVAYAKSLGMAVEFSAEDATRTHRTYLLRIYRHVTEAGADRIDIPDTVGYATPQYMAQITKDVMSVTNLPVSVHCHNDFGFAVANTVYAIEAGAQSAHVTVNGVGERAGNASMEQVVTALAFMNWSQTYSTGIDMKQIYEASQLVSRLFKMDVQPNWPIVGANAFAHESGIHTHGMVNNPLTYEVLDPAVVGRERELVAGKHAGGHGVSAMLESHGIRPTRPQLAEIVQRVKRVGDEGGVVATLDLVSIARDVIGEIEA